MPGIALSVTQTPIRLTDERWRHIVENHDDMAGHYDDALKTLEDTDYIIKGYGDALIALEKVDNENSWPLFIRNSLTMVLL